MYRFMGLESPARTGEGAILIDEQGRQYIDCAGGYGVFVHGYRHPRILQAAREQLEQLPLSSHVLPDRAPVDLAERLAQLTPGDLQYSFFCNSGAEAVEAAIKFARAATGRSRIVSTWGAFHGKTLGALSVSGRTVYQDPFRPLVPEIVHVPYGDLNALAAVMNDTVAAVIVEPIQGEGGIIVPPDDYLPGIRHLCTTLGAMMIVDEVQTGIAHTGKLFAIEYAGVVPDLLCLAKALGGGVMPIGAVVGRPISWTFFDANPLLHTSTFGGNPLATRVALEALNVAVDERLPERAAELGTVLLEALQTLQAAHSTLIREVRGRGLMIGVECASEGVAGALMAELFQRQVLAVYTLNNEKVIRLLPPAVIRRDQIDLVVERWQDSLHALEAEKDELL
jgi:putrescine aminotransferase